MTKDLALLVGDDQEFLTTRSSLPPSRRTLQAAVGKELRTDENGVRLSDAPARSPSPAPPARSATRCCSGSRAARCSARTPPCT